MDSTVCPVPPARCRCQEKAPPDGAEPDDHARGRSRGGLSTAVHLAGDSRARSLALRVTAGQAGDASAFETVMTAIRVPRSGPGRPRTRPDLVLADRAYSPRAIRSHLRRRGIRAVSRQLSDQSATASGEAAPAADSWQGTGGSPSLDDGHAKCRALSSGSGFWTRPAWC
ncbi:transposase [Streptomyces sp. NPDC052092]|uniref:transposase n=1 Tax=Streptomyces sp. NPDC052092 TaxID=3365685 RepID=UPI0037CCF43E